MLKIAHIRKPNQDEAIRELSEIFKANDMRRQEKRIEQLKRVKCHSNKKVAATTNS